jgi:transposase-like protein
VLLTVARFLPGKNAMIITAIHCPHCQTPEHVVKHGTTRYGTERCRCKACHKSFAPLAKSRKTSPEKEHFVERALAERLSQRAIARACQVGFATIRRVAKEAQKNRPTSPNR